MKILGLNVGHNATACLLQDGELTHCVSEERFTRKKNFLGIPLESIAWILKESQSEAKDIDRVMFFGAKAPHHASLPVQTASSGSAHGESLLRRWFLNLESHAPAFGKWAARVYRQRATRHYDHYLNQMVQILESKFGFKAEQVGTTEHHQGHAWCAALQVPWEEKALVFSCDGEGDNVSATVSILHQGKMERLAETSADDSLGILYLKITELLGMKGNEHEFKVMGLAPYAKPEKAEEVFLLLKEFFWFDPKNPLAFYSKFRTSSLDERLRRLLRRKRFDAIAAGVQKLTEELLCEWVTRAMDQTGIKQIAVTGGVFMNVKANQKIAELEQVQNVYPFPSCGDESGAIGAAVDGYLKRCEEVGCLPTLKPLKHLYLGSDIDQDIERQIQENQWGERYDIQRCEDIESAVAEQLAKGNVVARFWGRMEWGARALGHRSILADPRDFGVVRIINECVKNRDFWMPFAASVLKEREADYLINPKKLEAPYMAITFQTTPLAQAHFPAAIHPYDFTVRPQIVSSEYNPQYHRLIKAFEALTGVGAILNTSFNLHGEPNVCTLKDAIHTLDESGLNWLAAGTYLFRKKEKVV